MKRFVHRLHVATMPDGSASVSHDPPRPDAGGVRHVELTGPGFLPGPPVGGSLKDVDRWLSSVAGRSGAFKARIVRGFDGKAGIEEVSHKEERLAAARALLAWILKND